MLRYLVPLKSGGEGSIIFRNKSITFSYSNLRDYSVKVHCKLFLDIFWNINFFITINILRNAICGAVALMQLHACCFPSKQTCMSAFPWPRDVGISVALAAHVSLGKTPSALLEVHPAHGGSMEPRRSLSHLMQAGGI